jgi:transcriptional regulator with XRE-family HTH domain
MKPQYSTRLGQRPAKFHNEIRRYRLQSGLTQREIARVLKIRASTFSAWERGLTCPAGSHLLRLAKALDTLSEALYPQFYRRDGADQPLFPRTA